MRPTWLRLVTATLAIGMFSGCQARYALPSAQPMLSLPAGSTASSLYGPTTVSSLSSSGTDSEDAYKPSGSLPPASSFQVVQCTCTQVLPDDTSGLHHQRFMVKVSAPDPGMVLEVDHDTTFAPRVQPLAVGAAMTIKGVEYHDPGKDGIHWTHHSDDPSIGGYIKLATGQIFQ